MRSAVDIEVQMTILSQIEENLDITLQEVAVECQLLVNLKRNSHKVQQSILATRPALNAIQKQQNSMSLSSTHELGCQGGVCSKVSIQDALLSQVQKVRK